MTAHPEGLMHDMAEELRSLRLGEVPEPTVDVLAKAATRHVIDQYAGVGGNVGDQALLAVTLLDRFLTEVEEGTVYDKDAYFGSQARGVVEALREAGVL